MAGQPITSNTSLQTEEITAFRLTTNAGVPLRFPSRQFRGGLEATIKALGTNTGNIYLDGSTVNSATSFPLAPGEFINVTPTDLNEFYLDVDVNGEGVAVIHYTEAQ